MCPRRQGRDEGLITVADPVTISYISRCVTGDRDLMHAVERARVRFPPALTRSCGAQLLARPMFIGKAEMAACTDALTQIFNLLVSLPVRLFGGDFSSYCRAINIDPCRAAMIERFAGPPTLYGRADMYHDGISLKLLEFNTDSVIGGTERSEVSRLLLEVDAFRRFADAHGLSYVHTGERVVRALHAAAQSVTGGAIPTVAYVERDGGLSGYMSLVLSFQEMMRRLGVDVMLGEISQLQSKAGRLCLHGKPIDVVLRYFGIEDIPRSGSAAEAVERIFRAHEEGKVVLWTTMRSWQIFNKGCLALLSDNRSREAFSPQERNIIDRVLPWTRRIIAGDRDVMEQCRAYRNALILKPYGGYGGAGVIAGWKVSDNEWKEVLLEVSRNGDHVAQRRIVPRTEPVVNPETGKVENWSAVWDAYLTPEGYAGSRVRALPGDDHGVINMRSSSASRIAGVFLCR